MVAFRRNTDAVVHIVPIALRADGEVEIAELGGESVDVNRGRSPCPPPECRGGDHQRVAVFHDDQMPEQVDPLRVGPEMGLVASRRQVAVTLAPTEGAACRIREGAEVVKGFVGFIAQDVADSAVHADKVRPVRLPIYFVPGVGVSNLAVWLSSCAWANMRPPPFLGIETE